jgi:hypothetical protein
MSRVLPTEAKIIEIEDAAEIMSMIAEHYAEEFEDEGDNYDNFIEADELVAAGGTVCFILKGTPS